MGRTRRSVLYGLSTVTVAAAGCMGSESGDRPSSTAGRTPDAGGNVTPGGEAGERDIGDTETSVERPETAEPPGEAAYALTVERAAADRLEDRLGVGTLEGLSPTVRNATREAVDSGYETDSVSEALAAFVAAHEYVTVDGEYYELDAAFPRTVLVLEPIDSDVDPANVAGARVIRRDDVIADAVSEAIRSGKASRTVYPEALREAVATYDYVTPTDPDEADADIYAWSLETDDAGGPPYGLDATAVSESELYGDEVVTLESLPADAQSEIERALEEGRVSSEESPAVLDAGNPDFVLVDGEVYRLAVSVAN